MIQKYQFRAVIDNAGGGGAYVNIPFDVEQAFGKKRVKVKATIDGEPYRSTFVRMGNRQHMLLMLKEIRENIGKSLGEDEAKREQTRQSRFQKTIDKLRQVKSEH
jgi:hypothetical protein